MEYDKYRVPELLDFTTGGLTCKNCRTAAITKQDNRSAKEAAQERLDRFQAQTADVFRTLDLIGKQELSIDISQEDSAGHVMTRDQVVSSRDKTGKLRWHAQLR